MHAADQKPLQILNNLIGVNNNRIECFNYAVKETEVSVMRILFSRLLESSHICKEELAREVYKLGGIPEEGTIPYFEFFRAWVDVKSAITKKDHAGILNSCEYEEGVVVKSYENALKFKDENLTTHHHNIFHKQYDIIKSGYEKVKNLRNALVKA